MFQSLFRSSSGSS